MIGGLPGRRQRPRQAESSKEVRGEATKPKTPRQPADADGDRPQIPAVALTAYASRDDKVRLLSAGFQAHVPKPVDTAELVAVIVSLARSASKL